MRRLLAALALACALAAPAAQAQSTDPVLEHGAATASATAQGAIAIDVPWTYSGPAASAAVGDAGLDVTWAADCQGATGSTAGRFALEPGQATVAGVSALRFDAPGLEPFRPVQCVLDGRAESAVPGSEAEDQLTLTVTVPVHLNITVAVQEPEQRAKPQSQIPYLLEVTNHGNGRTIVRFADVGEGHRGTRGWFALPPEAVALDAGQTVNIPLVVMTPYHNGYVKGDRDFRFVATPESVVQGGPVGEPVEFGVQAHVQGFYIPGPSPALVAVALAGLALLARRG